jgi:hypothetical protein
MIKFIVENFKKLASVFPYILLVTLVYYSLFFDLEFKVEYLEKLASVLHIYIL